MKIFVTILLVFLYFGSYAQTWKSINKLDTYKTNPYFQFAINPYTNDIWMVGLGNGGVNQLAVIENDGDIEIFPRTMNPAFLWGSDLAIAFTPNHVYYAHDNYGLFTFDNYTPELKLGFTDYSGKLRSNSDTVYILLVDVSSILRHVKFDGTISFYTDRNSYNLVAKNEFLYAERSSNTTIVYYTDATNNFTYLFPDPEYLGGQYNEMKFTRNTDTLFVAGKLGISKVYNYDVFDTITPNNTINMPSPNVLEMEWDMEDNLWAVFGDASDAPFAIAKLENDTWTNYFDANNSPIDFTSFNGLEIDTLSNIWVSDEDALHTLLTPNSPAWLGTNELELNSSFEVYPNPSNGSFTIATKEIQIVSEIEIVDLMGRTVHQQSFQPKITLELPSGNYFLQLKNEGQLLGVQKIMIE